MILFSGRKKTIGWFKDSVRKDRNPRDTPREIHYLLDDMFKDKFGVRARTNSIFCYNDHFKALQYGDPYYIFPVGKYTAIWSTSISDLYIKLKAIFGGRTIDIWDSLHDDLKKKYLSHLKNESNIMGSYTDNPYKYNNGREIMLCCKEYIGIRWRPGLDIKQWIV